MEWKKNAKIGDLLLGFLDGMPFAGPESKRSRSRSRGRYSQVGVGIGVTKNSSTTQPCHGRHQRLLFLVFKLPISTFYEIRCMVTRMNRPLECRGLFVSWFIRV